MTKVMPGKLEDDLKSLWDPNYRRWLFELFSTWIKEFDCFTDAEKKDSAKKIRELAVEPLDLWT